MPSPIQLIVGLGNPGPDYEKTRHNVGAWFAESLAEQVKIPLRLEKKFHGKIARIEVAKHDYWVLLPTTYMNKSGLSVKAMTDFYRITPDAILVAHDDLDLPVGTIRLKFDGGHGGHNGLRDLIHHLGTTQFYRLRIGIGHPGHRDKVLDYVLQPPSIHDKKRINAGIDEAIAVLPYLLSGNGERAMQELHTKKQEN